MCIPKEFYSILEKYVSMLSFILFHLLSYPVPQIHLGPVKLMKYNHEYDTVISADEKGMIEYWNPATLEFPENGYVFFGMLI